LIKVAHTGAISGVLVDGFGGVCVREIVVCMQMKIFNAGGAFSILHSPVIIYASVCWSLPVCVFEILISIINYCQRCSN